MKEVKTLFSMLVLLFLIASCSNDSSNNQNKIKIAAKATYNPTASRVTSASASNINVVLTSFKINIKEIEFKLSEQSDNDDDTNDDNDNAEDNGDDDNDGYFDGDDEVGLQGPWELDLLNQSAPITTVTIANGTYEEVEFKLNKSLVNTSPLFNKTIEIRGTINGTPFVFWHNFEQEFSVDYEDINQSLVINNNSYDLVFNFDLNQWIANVDLSDAIDGDGDGTIEIGPDDTDGNNALAQQLNEDLEDATEIDD